MSVFFYSPKTFISIGNVKGQSLKSFINIGNVKGQSLKAFVGFQFNITISEPIGPIEAGYADITWMYNDSIKTAIGTFNYPLYNNARFKLIATNQVKNPDNMPIINPQDRDYIT
jgi:hypothetical protein